MGLIAVVLFTYGYWAHAGALAKAGHRIIGRVAALIATIAFGLFAIALGIDGFVVPEAALSYLQGGPGAATLQDVEHVHRDALYMFTPGVFLMFMAGGVLSSRLLHGFVHSRWLGGVGMLIAIAGPSAYLTGVAGPNWSNLQIGGSLMMLAFLWHFMVGLAALFGRGVKTREAS